MLCQACAESEERPESEVRPEAEETPEGRSEAPGDSNQLCSRCGDLLGPQGMELHARRKKSQLEKFGLAGSRRLLRKRKDPRG